MQNILPVTRALLIANVLVFLLQQVAPGFLIMHWALWPIDVALEDGSWLFEPWQLVSYGFLHGSLAHIAFNMLALWMFGDPVEAALGSRRYAFYYFVCVVGAAIAQLATIHFLQPDKVYPTLGASGGVFGLLLAAAFIFPRGKVIEFPFPIPLPTPVVVVGYLVAELVYGVTGTQEGVAHFAHLGGALAGFLVLRYWRAQHARGNQR